MGKTNKWFQTAQTLECSRTHCTGRLAPRSGEGPWLVLVPAEQDRADAAKGHTSVSIPRQAWSSWASQESDECSLAGEVHALCGAAVCVHDRSAEHSAAVVLRGDLQAIKTSLPDSAEMCQFHEVAAREFTRKFNRQYPIRVSGPSCDERAVLSSLATLVRSSGSDPARWEAGSWADAKRCAHTVHSSPSATAASPRYYHDRRDSLCGSLGQDGNCVALSAGLCASFGVSS